MDIRFFFVREEACEGELSRPFFSLPAPPPPSIRISLLLLSLNKHLKRAPLTGQVLARHRLVLVVDRLEAVRCVGDLGGLVLRPGEGRVGLLLQSLERGARGDRVLLFLLF